MDKNFLEHHHHPSTPSTNTLAKEASAEGPVWEIFVTDHQTGGYGFCLAIEQI